MNNINFFPGSGGPDIEALFSDEIYDSSIANSSTMAVKFTANEMATIQWCASVLQVTMDLEIRLYGTDLTADTETGEGSVLADTTRVVPITFNLPCSPNITNGAKVPTPLKLNGTATYDEVEPVSSFPAYNDGREASANTEIDGYRVQVLMHYGKEEVDAPPASESGLFERIYGAPLADMFAFPFSFKVTVTAQTTPGHPADFGGSDTLTVISPKPNPGPHNRGVVTFDGTTAFGWFPNPGMAIKSAQEAAPAINHGVRITDANVRVTITEAAVPV